MSLLNVKCEWSCECSTLKPCQIRFLSNTIEIVELNLSKEKGYGAGAEAI